MTTAASAGLWRNWQTDDPNGDVAVTSERFGDDVKTASKYFPKVRSWLALGAPMELLSPLSILRVLFPLTLVIEGFELSDAAMNANPLMASIITAVTLVVCLVLLRIQTIGARASELLWVLILVILNVGTMDTNPDVPYSVAASFAGLFALMPVLAMATLFFPPRVVGRFIGVTFLGIYIGFASSAMTWSTALIAAGFGVGTMSIAVALIGLLTRANRRLGTIDPDTGLLNGFGLADKMLEAPSQARIVASVRLTGISDAREALGYRVGTELRRRAVEDLGQSLPSGALIGRVGGDEVLVVLPAKSAVDDGTMRLPGKILDEARAVAETLVATIDAGRYAAGTLEVRLRAHVGVAVSPWHGEEIADLARYSAFAAERAEELGQSVGVHDQAHRRLSPADLQLLSDLRNAVGNGQLWVAYQPQVAAGTADVVGVEALLRWSHPERGFVSPGEFIPLAERTGQVDALTDWVLNEALDAQVRWRLQGHVVPVSVNISARSLTRPELPMMILDMLAARGLPTAALTVEVTETAATPDLLLAVNLLRPLHEAGVRVSIDDFGTGYTSLSVLPSLPLSELKVDQQFVRRSTNSPADAAIVESLRELAHRLDLTAVAEGVEDELLDLRIAELGFDVIQGYFHSKPLAEEALVAFLDGKRLAEIASGRRAA